jgi:hypothetical protein
MPFDHQDQQQKDERVAEIKADLDERWIKARRKALCIVKISPRRHIVCRIGPVTTYFLGSVIFGPAPVQECLDYLHKNT